ncbi:MAG: pilus assembly protein TadG-related protein [Pseudomonadota bacterium]
MSGINFIGRVAKRFNRDERGNVALLTAGMAVPLAGIIFTAIEFADNISVHNDLQHAADEAALAALAKPSQRWRDRQRTARSLFLANLDRDERIDKLRWRLRRKYTPLGLTVTYQAQAKMMPMFGGLTPFGERTLKIESAAIRYRDNRMPPRLISTKNASERTLN